MGDKITSKPGRDVVPVEKEYRINFSIMNAKDKYIYISPEEKGHILTVDDNSKLSYDAIYYKPNQKFKLEVIQPGIFLIQNRGKCVEFIPEDQNYIMLECTSSTYQMFHIFGTEEENNNYKLKISDKSYVDSEGMGYNKKKLPVININSEKIEKYLKHMNMEKRHPGELRNRNHHAITESNQHSKDNTIEKYDASSGAFGEAGFYNNIGASSYASASGNQGIYGDSSISGKFKSSKHHTHFENPGHSGRYGHHEHPGNYGHFGKSVKYGDSSAASISNAASFAKATEIASGNHGFGNNFEEEYSNTYLNGLNHNHLGGLSHHSHFGNPGHPGRHGYHVKPSYEHL